MGILWEADHKGVSVIGGPSLDPTEWVFLQAWLYELYPPWN